MKKRNAMQAIEFIAHSENGVIKIPQEYQAQLEGDFRVIILKEEINSIKSSSKKRRLTAVQITTKDLTFDRDETNTKS